MCLFVDSDAKEQIAIEDIIVYKTIGESTNLSFFQDFRYEPNTLYNLGKELKVEERTIDDDECHVIEEGFHSFADSRDSFADSRESMSLKTVEFVIPKGTKYYVGRWHGDTCYVSTSIRSGSLEDTSFGGWRVV